jgi:hypothetical protein
VGNIIPEILMDMDPQYVAQVALTAALNTMLDETTVELQDLHT